MKRNTSPADRMVALNVGFLALAILIAAAVFVAPQFLGAGIYTPRAALFFTAVVGALLVGALALFRVFGR